MIQEEQAGLLPRLETLRAVIERHGIVFREQVPEDRRLPDLSGTGQQQTFTCRNTSLKDRLYGTDYIFHDAAVRLL